MSIYYYDFRSISTIKIINSDRSQEHLTEWDTGLTGLIFRTLSEIEVHSDLNLYSYCSIGLNRLTYIMNDFLKCSITNFYRRLIGKICKCMPAFLGNSSLNSMNSLNTPELLNWMSHYWITLLNLKTAILSYIRCKNSHFTCSRISHAVKCSDMHAGSEKNTPGPGWGGSSIEPVKPPWLRAWE